MDAAADNAGPGITPSLGQKLAAERERHGLSRAEVAQRLHMSALQVEALEGDDFARLPKGTFLRGFVRNYAKLLGIAPEPLLGMLAQTGPREPAPGIVVPTQNIRFDPLSERFSGPYVKAATLALVAVVLAFAAMYWWLFIRPTPPAVKKLEIGPVAVAPTSPTQPGADAAPSAPQPAPPVESPARSAATPPAAVAPKTDAPKADAPNADASKGDGAAGASAKSAAPAKSATPTKLAATTAAATKAAEPAKAAPGEHVLRFHFKGESWVEVRDARSSRILFQRLNSAGTDAEVRGRPPLEIVVGNAPEVEMFDGGRPYPLEPHTNVAVARFTLE